MAGSFGIEIIPPSLGQRSTSLPRRLADSCAFETTGSRDCSDSSVYQAYRVKYFEAIDKVLSELHKRFGEPRPILLSIASLSPDSPSFLDFDSISPLAESYKLDLGVLSSQVEVAKHLLKQRNLETLEDCLKFLASQEGVFQEVSKLYKLPLTIPVTSASAERSFSVLRREKTYLRSTMGQERLTDISILAINRDLAKSIDFDSVVDNFMRQNPRRIVLQ